jgi:hypothetical protein
LELSYLTVDDITGSSCCGECAADDPDAPGGNFKGTHLQVCEGKGLWRSNGTKVNAAVSCGLVSINHFDSPTNGDQDWARWGRTMATTNTYIEMSDMQGSSTSSTAKRCFMGPDFMLFTQSSNYLMQDNGAGASNQAIMIGCGTNTVGGCLSVAPPHPGDPDLLKNAFDIHPSINNWNPQSKAVKFRPMTVCMDGKTMKSWFLMSHPQTLFYWEKSKVEASAGGSGTGAWPTYGTAVGA